MFRAKSKFIRVSPFKMRPLADVVRGISVERALAWLKTCSSAKRVRPIEKTIFSAFSNARDKNANLAMGDVFIKEIRVDQGPTFKYYKPGAQGRSVVQRKRLSHLEVVLEQREQKKKQNSQR